MPKNKHKKKLTNNTYKKQKTSVFVKFVSNFNKISSSKKILWLSLIILVITVFVYYPNIGGDYDIWWHLKYGEHFVHNVTWNIDHTNYSWTPTDGEWQYVTWIGSSLLYLVYKLGAFPGLNILQWMILFSIAFFYLYFLSYCKDSPKITHVTAYLFVLIALNPKAIYIKPELFSIFLFTSTVFIYFISKFSLKNYFFFYPILLLIWINTHGAFIIGLSFISLTLLLEVCNFLFIKKNNIPKGLLQKFIIFVVLSYAVLFINPHGINYPFGIIKGHLSGGASQYSTIIEYRNIWEFLSFSRYISSFRITNTAWISVLMILSILFLSGYQYWKKRNFDLSVLTINIIFFIFGMNLLRASLYFPILWLFSWQYTVKKSAFRIIYYIAPMTLILFILTVITCIFNTLSLNTYDSWFGSKIDNTYPNKEAEFIMESELPGPIFNDYLTGGYLIWALNPNYKVFIDPRYTLYLKSGLWDDYEHFSQNLSENTLKIFESKYPFNTAIINHIKKYQIVELFIKSPDWQLVYFDTIAAVFVHNDIIHSLDIKDFQKNLSTERYENIINPIILGSVFLVYYNMGDMEHAKTILEIYENNVSVFYFNKNKIINSMRNILTFAR